MSSVPIQISDDSSVKDEKNQTFLSELQQEGKASGKVSLDHLDEELEKVSHILNEEAARLYRETPEEEWPTCKMAVYSHDIREIVPGSVAKNNRGKSRIVCGKTGSRKISMGREDALRKFYHMDKEEKKKAEREARKQERSSEKTSNPTDKSGSSTNSGKPTENRSKNNRPPRRRR